MSIDPDSPSFRLVTDGPLPLRQCLHPEACAKDIDLPPYYCRYSDLRKEFVRYNSDDLSRALIPVKDAKKLPNMPALPAPPPSIADMMNGKWKNFRNSIKKKIILLFTDGNFIFPLRFFLSSAHKCWLFILRKHSMGLTLLNVLLLIFRL